MKDQQKQYKGLLERVRGLLIAWHSAGVDVFVQLRSIDNEGTWKLGQHATFQAFLTREFPDVIGIHQYNHVIRAVEEYGVEFVRKVGISSAHALIHPAIVSSPERKAEVQASVEHHIAKDGCAPGNVKVTEIVRSVAPEARKPCAEVKAVRKAAAGKSEVQNLRTRIKELEKENTDLKREIERLNGLLRKAA